MSGTSSAPYGYEFDSLGIRSADGQLLAEIPDARSGGPDLPATVGAYRPKLAELLADAAVAAGAKVRLGTSVESFTQDADGVDVVFSDGETGRYDLLVGADGVRSQTRRQLGIDITPQPVGMGIWRVHAARPAEVTRTDLVYNGPCYIAGYCPTGPDTLYAYLVEKSQNRFTDTPRGEGHGHAGTGRGLPRAVGRHPRGHHRPGSDQLHPLRNRCSSTGRGTAAGRWSSVTPRMPARPPWPRARRWRWKTPPCSPNCC